jgi:hypothetical protein
MPEGLAGFLDLNLPPGTRRDCAEPKRCALFAVELDGQPEPEYCLAASDAIARCFARSGDTWTDLGRLREIQGAAAETLRSDLAEHPPEAVPGYNDVRVGGKLYRIVPR